MILETRQQAVASLAQALLARLRYLLHVDVEFAEVMAGAAALGGGIVWLNPYSNTFDTSRNYAAMHGLYGWFGTEVFWGILGMTLGVVALGALLAGRPRPRQWAMFALSLFYLFIGISFAWSNFWAWGLVQVALLFCAATWTQWRLALSLRAQWM